MEAKNMMPSNSSEKEFIRSELERIATLLTDSPETIPVSCEAGDKTTVYRIHCPQAFIGQLIGSKGKTIGSLRNVFFAITARLGYRSVIEIPYYEPG